MRKIQLIIICLLIIVGKANAQVTIGTGMLVDRGIPVEPAGSYSYSQVIYLASEIAANGNITTLTYYATPLTTLTNSKDWTIYMGHTTKTDFTNTIDWTLVYNLTQVFSGIVTISGGVVTISLDTPFNYNGIDNLMIAVDENSANPDVWNHDFYTTSVIGNRAIRSFSPVGNPDPNAPPTATNISPYIANVTLGGITQAGPVPTLLNVSSLTTTSADLGWTESGTATTWNIEWDTAGFTLGTGNMVTGTTTNPHQLSGLTPATTYQFYVKSDYDTLGTSWWSNPYTFATMGIPQFKFHLAFEDATGAKDTVWLILDSLATGGYDTIFGEIPVSIPTGVFQVYIEIGMNDTSKVSAVPTSYTSGGFQILAQNYVYPLILYWDTSLIYNNNLPFTIDCAYLDNDWFFFNNDGTLMYLFNMMNTDSVELPKFYYGSQEQFPMNFTMSSNLSTYCSVSIKEEHSKTGINLYPNPTSDKLLVELNDNINTVIELKLMDVRGTVLKQLSIADNRTILDISDLPSGLYFIEMFNNSFSYREKLIKY